MRCLCWFCFFFQAEDGIRDLVRSRGLGDVYKRQGHRAPGGAQGFAGGGQGRAEQSPPGIAAGRSQEPVSYTHLTLPTSDLV